VVTLETFGFWSINFADTASPVFSVSQQVSVFPAATSRLAVTGYPSPASPGSWWSFLVTAQDAYGNTTPGYQGTVHFTSSDPAAVLPGDYPFSSYWDSGVAVFDASLVTFGTQSITATDTASPGITGSQTGIEVLPVITISTGVAGGPVTVTEGNAGTRLATFTVSLSSASTEVVTVDYTTIDILATGGTDCQAASGTLTFAPGETRKTISVVVYGDRLAESNEDFWVRLSNPTKAGLSADDAARQARGLILDDEPRISISDVSKKEGKKNQTTQFTFTVTLSAAYDQAVTVSFRTADGTARTSDSDYVARTGTLTFAPGETTKTITIVVNGDNKKESDEVFYLDLFGNSSNALFNRNRGLGTILNDD
jgi:hypothetical protein